LVTISTYCSTDGPLSRCALKKHITLHVAAPNRPLKPNIHEQSDPIRRERVWVEWFALERGPLSSAAKVQMQK